MATGERLVLVVEDEPRARGAVARLLELAGFTVVEAGNGVEALRRMRMDPRPSAVVLDLLMPVLDGWTFCEQIQGDPELSSIPIIVCSGAPPELQQSGGLAIRVQEFLPKPIDAEVLVATLRRVAFDGRGSTHDGDPV